MTLPFESSWKHLHRQHKRSRHTKKLRHFNKRRQQRKESVLYHNQQEPPAKQKANHIFPSERIKDRWSKQLSHPAPLIDRDYQAVRRALCSRNSKRHSDALGILIGWAVHKVIASLPANSRGGFLAALSRPKQDEAAEVVRQLLARTQYFRQLPEAEAAQQTQRITAQVTGLVKIAMLLQAADSGHFVRELPLAWMDTTISWKLTGRPDRMGLIVLPDGTTTLMLAELKTSKSVSDIDQQQLLFYGMLACLSYGLREQDKVKLVLRSLGSATEYVYYYPASRVSKDLERVRRLLKHLDTPQRQARTLNWHRYVCLYNRFYPHEEHKQLFRPCRMLDKDGKSFTDLSDS